MSPEEWEAMQLVWEREGNSGAPITEAEAVRILVEIRARKAEIEAKASSLADQAMRENRRQPRRHQRFALLMLMAAFALAAAAYLVSQIVRD